MNENTQVLPELDEELDFDIECQAGNEDGNECPNVAKWMAVAPCGHSPFMCDSHRALAAAFAMTHSKVTCIIENCGAHFCLCGVLWRHL